MSSKPVILVIDDDVPILTLMRNLLEGFGFEARVPSTGSEAIAAARERRPDMVLLDKNIPGTSGSEILRALRNEPGAKQMPILILSGEPVEPDEIERLGAVGAVLKPFDVTDLVERIRSHVGVAR